MSVYDDFGSNDFGSNSKYQRLILRLNRINIHQTSAELLCHHNLWLWYSSIFRGSSLNVTAVSANTRINLRLTEIKQMSTELRNSICKFSCTHTHSHLNSSDIVCLLWTQIQCSSRFLCLSVVERKSTLSNSTTSRAPQQSVATQFEETFPNATTMRKSVDMPPRACSTFSKPHHWERASRPLLYFFAEIPCSPGGSCARRRGNCWGPLAALPRDPALCTSWARPL